MRLPLTIAAAFAICAAHAQAPAPRTLTVASAASVAPAVEEIAKAWAPSGTEIVMVPGATHQLARQIRDGAPFDLFVSADMESVTALEAEGFAAQGSVSEWARGVLVVWQDASAKPVLETWTDVARADVRRIAVASPEVAPYGRAAMEALASAGIADAVKDRLVFGSDVRQGLQWARTGNVDAAFVAASLVKDGDGRSLPVPEGAHAPIRHGLAVVKKSPNAEAAAALAKHIAEAPESRAVLQRHGLAAPPQEVSWGSD